MKEKNKILKVAIFVIIITLACLGSAVYGQDVPTSTVVLPVSSEKGGGSVGGASPQRKSTALPFDVAIITNRAEVASLAVRSVDNLQVKIYNAANASIGDGSGDPNAETFILPFTNSVKSFKAMTEMLEGTSFKFKVVDPTEFTSVNVSFNIGYPTNSWYGDDQPFQTVIYGYNQGQLVPNDSGGYTLPPEASHLTVRLNQNIRFKKPGLISGKAIHNQNGYSYGSSLYVSGSGEFDLPMDVVQSGTVVMYGNFDGNGNKTVALSLVTGKEVPLLDVDIRVLLQDSEDFHPYTNPSRIDITQESYNGYGVNPLIILTLTQPGFSAIPLTLRTTEGITPTKYRIVNLTTGQPENGLLVPDGTATVNLILPPGEYHIIPDLPVKSVSGGGGKG